MAIKKEYQNQLIKLIHKYIPKCTIYLFGSRATDQEQQGSDIDIAVDCGSPIPHNTLLKILIDFDETTIPMTLDLIDLQTASTELKQEIMHEGIRWTN